MPPDIHAALARAANAAANLRARLSDLATAVECGDEDAIVLAARALVTGDAAITLPPHSPEPPETKADPELCEGESP